MQLNEEEKEKGVGQTLINKVSSRRLKICHISDTHGKHERLTIPECDVLICSGDISMIGQRKEVELFFEWFKRQAQATHKILVPGNHDLTFDVNRGGNKGSKPEWLVELLAEFYPGHSSNNYYLENDTCEIWGVKFWGSPTSTWFHGDRWAFNLYDGDDANDLYSTIPSGTDVVITHGPAYTKQDWVINCACYVGSHDLLNHIKRVKPLLHLCGHIHESYGTELTSYGTHHFNGSNCGLDYEIRNKPWLLDVDFDEKEVNILNKT